MSEAKSCRQSIFLFLASLHSCLWYLWPITFVSAFAFANLTFGILGLIFAIDFLRTSGYQQALKRLWQEFPPIKVLAGLSLWSIFVLIAAKLLPFADGIPVKASRAYHKPLLIMLVALIYLSFDRFKAIRISLFTLLIAVCLAVFTFPSVQVHQFGWLRLVPTYPGGMEVLGAGQAGGAASFVAIVLCGTLFFMRKTWLSTALLSLGLLILLLFIVLTGARSAAFMVVIGLGLVCLRFFLRSRKGVQLKYILLGGLLLATVASAMMYFNPRLRPGGASFATRFRAIIWANGLKMISRRPVCGYGPSNLAPVFRQGKGLQLDGPQGKLMTPNEAHGDPVSWMMMFGIPGYLLYLLFLGSLINFQWSQAKELSGVRRGLAEGGGAGVAAAFAFSLFSSVYFDSELGPFIFLFTAVICATALKEKPREAPSIVQVNLAKGYRGGERQTEMLIKSLAESGLRQRLIVRENSPLIEKLKDVQNLETVGIPRPFVLSAFLVEDAKLLHGHEAKGAQFALHASYLHNIPYVLTRRVMNPNRVNVYNRTIFRYSKQVICLSKAIHEGVTTEFPEAKCRIIPSMVSDIKANDQAVRDIKRRFEGKFLVGHAGELDWKTKGQHTLIEAARELSSSHSDIHFILLGKGKDEAYLKDLAQGLSNITFEGFRTNIADYIAALDLFAFPSLNEGLGSVLLDVMNFKVPVVASNVGGIPDIVIDGKTGVLVPPNDASRLAQVIIELKADGKKRSELAQNAYKNTKAYSARKISEQHLVMYKELIPQLEQGKASLS